MTIGLSIFCNLLLKLLYVRFMNVHAESTGCSKGHSGMPSKLLLSEFGTTGEIVISETCESWNSSSMVQL